VIYRKVDPQRGTAVVMPHEGPRFSIVAPAEIESLMTGVVDALGLIDQRLCSQPRRY
jgi:hypothetical protein